MFCSKYKADCFLHLFYDGQSELSLFDWICEKTSIYFYIFLSKICFGLYVYINIYIYLFIYIIRKVCMMVYCMFSKGLVVAGLVQIWSIICYDICSCRFYTTDGSRKNVFFLF